MSKHSPGPWRVSYSGRWGWMVDSNGRCVAVDINADDTALIAAAPEMLEFIRRLGRDADKLIQPERYVVEAAAMVKRIDGEP